MLSVLSPKLCRACGRTSRDVAFAKTSLHRCKSCADERKQQRADRLTERGPRVAVAVAVSEADSGCNPRHLAWIRRFPCAVRSLGCSKIVHAHHIRSASSAGTAMKPPDAMTVPLCSIHHAELHQVGVRTFEMLHRVDLPTLAGRLAMASPHIRRDAR